MIRSHGSGFYFSRLAPAASFRATPLELSPSEFALFLIRKLWLFGFEQYDKRQNVKNNTGNLLTWPMTDLDLFLQVWIGIPIFMVVVSAYLVFAPFYDVPLQSFYCLLFVSAGIPFYLVFVRYKVVPPSFLRFVGEPLLICLHFKFPNCKANSNVMFPLSPLLS